MNSPSKKTVKSHRGCLIVTKEDHGRNPPENPGFVVTDGEGICNVMPGATWFQTVKEAKDAIDILCLVSGDTDLFWERMQPFDYTHIGQHVPGVGYDDTLVTCGKFSAVIKDNRVVKLTTRSIDGSFITLEKGKKSC